MAKKKVKDQGDELNMDLSPMIDMVFLLLIFFIVVSTQSEVQTDPRVKPTIASRSAVQKDTIARIVVNVFKSEESGEVTYSNENTDIIISDELGLHIEEEVKAIRETRPTIPVTLHMRCDRAVEWKDIQKVKKAAALSGVINVNFASFQKE